MTKDSFYRASQLLVGETDLPQPLSEAYFQRISNHFDQSLLERFLTEFAKIFEEPDESARNDLIRTKILDVAEFSPLASAVILIWYTAEIHDDVQKRVLTGTPEEYFQGLLWKVVQAHPPGLSGGYFGHWTYPPDN